MCFKSISGFVHIYLQIIKMYYIYCSRLTMIWYYYQGNDPEITEECDLFCPMLRFLNVSPWRVEHKVGFCATLS